MRRHEDFDPGKDDEGGSGSNRSRSREVASERRGSSAASGWYCS
jgi:hypothetical protein